MSDERVEDPVEAREVQGGVPAAGSETAEEGEDTPSPFDHPAFLPVILAAVALWFGFDGWFNQEIESVRFNRYGFGFLMGAALYFALDELTRLPYLKVLLFLGYALWLGAFALLGPPGAWYNDEPSVQLFNRYACIGCLALAGLSALRETWRRRGRASGA